MTAQLNAVQREVQNAVQFRNQFTVLHQAAVGVILVRTREPFRAQDALRDFAFAEEEMEFRCWSVLHGWSTYDRADQTREPTTDGVKDPLAALMAISGIGTPRGGFGNGVFCLLYPHLLNLNKNPGLIQIVKEYSKLFAENKKRVVIIVPLGYELPPELEDDVVILDFDTPSHAEMRLAYNRLLECVSEPRRPAYSEQDVDRIINAGAGMVLSDFDMALSRAFATYRTELPNVGIDSIVDVIMLVKTEMVKKSEVLELMEASDMSHVGGLNNLKDWLVARKECFDQEARDYGIEAPRGIALIGPPGTGKSLMAKAVADMLGLPLVKFDVSRVFQSLVGQSEGRVRAALKMVDAMSPCVMFVDEADKAFQSNSSNGDSGVGQRVLGAILTWMQESDAPVFIVVTANRVDNLPSEFLRRGRLDEVFSVQMPSEEERMEVLRIHLRKRGQDPDTIDGLQEAVESSAGYVPAELEQAVKDALIVAYTSKDKELTGALIAEQLANMKPLSVAFAEQFEAMAQWASNNARPANVGEHAIPVGPRRRVRSDTPAGQRTGVDLDG